MEQLIAHLVGDYVLQSHKMALLKTQDVWWAFLHATFYSLPFLSLTNSWLAVAFILVTHAFIDHYKVAAKWCEFYGVGHPGLWWVEDDEPFVEPPPFLGVWLTILVDNTMHLFLNYIALKYL